MKQEETRNSILKSTAAEPLNDEALKAVNGGKEQRPPASGHIVSEEYRCSKYVCKHPYSPRCTKICLMGGGIAPLACAGNKLPNCASCKYGDFGADCWGGSRLCTYGQ